MLVNGVTQMRYAVSAFARRACSAASRACSATSRRSFTAFFASSNALRSTAGPASFSSPEDLAMRSTASAAAAAISLSECAHQPAIFGRAARERQPSAPSPLMAAAPRFFPSGRNEAVYLSASEINWMTAASSLASWAGSVAARAVKSAREQTGLMVHPRTWTG